MTPIGLAVVLVLAAAVRLFFLYLTTDQPLWWDEADYVLLARQFAGATGSHVWRGRPILLSLIFAPVARSELAMRWLETLFSLGAVLFLFLVVREISKSEGVSLLSAFLFSVWWMPLFYSTRLLTEVPSLFFLLAGMYAIVRSLERPSRVGAIMGGIALAAAVLTRFPLALAVLAIAVYVVVVEGRRVVRSRSMLLTAIALALALSPYFVWAAMVFGSATASVVAGGAVVGPTLGLPSLTKYATWFPHYFSVPFLVPVLIGLAAVLGTLVRAIDGSPERRRAAVLLAAWFALPYLYMSAQKGAHERYLLMALPAAIIAAGWTVHAAYEALAVRSRHAGFAFLAITLALVAVLELRHANEIIREKRHSYEAVKQAGVWLREHSGNDAVIATSSGPQMRYYADRAVISYDRDEAVFAARCDRMHPAYFVVSVFERHPDWLLRFLKRRGARPIHSFEFQKTPILVIYEAAR